MLQTRPISIHKNVENYLHYPVVLLGPFVLANLEGQRNHHGLGGLWNQARLVCLASHHFQYFLFLLVGPETQANLVGCNIINISNMRNPVNRSVSNQNIIWDDI
jgi:hypothetical protein